MEELRVSELKIKFATNLCHFELCLRVPANMGITSLSRRK